ncbi:MAG: hypothetical protein ACREHV_08770 [Rhizomicrobium sp.]
MLFASPGLGILIETERRAEVARALIGELAEPAGNPVHDVDTVILLGQHLSYPVRNVWVRCPEGAEGALPARVGMPAFRCAGAAVCYERRLAGTEPGMNE